MQAPGNPLFSLSPIVPIYVPVDSGVYAPVVAPAGATIVVTTIEV